MSPKVGSKLQIITCPLCSTFSSKRLTTFENHLNSEHSTTTQKLWDQINNGPIKCGCGCGSDTKWVNWMKGYSSFKIGHSSSIYAAFSAERAAEISNKRKNSLKGKTSWAKGLTKDNDDRIKNRARASAIGIRKSFVDGRSAWNKGLTKDNDERIAHAAANIKEEFASGERKAWHCGLTGLSDERIEKKNKDLKDKYASGELVQWHAGKTAAEDPRISKFWEHRDAMKEYAHVRFTNEEIEKHLESNVSLALESISKYKNNRTPSLHVRCRSCNWTSKVALVFAKNDRCPNCSPRGSISQNEIADWIESLGIKIGRNVTGVIGRQELDIFSFENKLAIEFNGLYYHNEAAGKDSQYHESKTEKCKKFGIRLLHIFEDEWYHKQDIVKSLISHRLGRSSKKIYARSCTIKEISSSDRKIFFNNNHIDGDTAAMHSLGLFYNDDLVAAISLRKPIQSHAGDIEIARCCTAINMSVVGGTSKLVAAAKSYAIKFGSKKLITYVDKRLGGTGAAYVAAGFTKKNETQPRFWWTDYRARFNRFKFKANKPLGLTEAQVAEEAGVVKIYGCGNILFELPLLPSLRPTD